MISLNHSLKFPSLKKAMVREPSRDFTEVFNNNVLVTAHITSMILGVLSEADSCPNQYYQVSDKSQFRTRVRCADSCPN